MDNQEAKFILQAYRPNGSDASAPELQAALMQARRDPALGQWLERECVLDAAIAAQLKRCAVASGLRDNILNGAKFARKPPLWRRPWVMAMAASVVLVFILAGLFYPRAVPSGLGLESFATHFAVNGIYLQNDAKDLAQLRSWLSNKGVELPEKLPEKLAKLGGVGCRTIDYDGARVALICFYQGNTGYHLFLAKRTDIPGRAFPETLHLASLAKGWRSAAWSDATHRYVLVTDASAEELSRYL